MGYWLVFHTFGVGDLQIAKYDKEMIAATEAQLAAMAGMEMNDDALLMIATLPERVDEGRELFTTYCVVCHMEQGQGSVGPNLTDEFWIHGGSPMAIHKTVTDGVLSKGMAAWGNQLGPKRVQSVVDDPRYEDAERAHHDHLIDLRSGNVIEFRNARIEALQEEIARELGYELVDHRLELYGIPVKKSEDGDTK